MKRRRNSLKRQHLKWKPPPVEIPVLRLDS
nr:MAG TPA_asm: hypothetical protein [Caudoviricetes sp.]